MPISNFPNGFSNGIVIRGIPLTQANPGKVFWVSNSTVLLDNQKNGSNGNKGTFNEPFATIQYAVDQAVAGRNDVIFVKPGHAETISAASGLTINKSGVAIVGLGDGSSRPTLTYSTANTATTVVSAANVSIQNLLFVGNFLSIANAIVVSGTDFAVEKCEFKDSSATLGFLTPIITTGAANIADGLYVRDNTVYSMSTSGGPMITVAQALDRLTMIDNFIVHSGINNNVSHGIAQGANVITRLNMRHNQIYSVNTDTATGGILLSATATTGSGIISENEVRCLDVAAAIIVSAAAVQYGLFDNLLIGDGTSNSGFTLPAVGSDA